MTLQDKELLLKDLCARLPYKVMVEHLTLKMPYPICTIDTNDSVIIGSETLGFYTLYITLCKLYLRPMSSMTEEEIAELDAMPTGADVCLPNGEGLTWIPNTAMSDYLNARHFDYRGLIDKGLAIEVTEENNPYK